MFVIKIIVHGQVILKSVLFKDRQIMYEVNNLPKFLVL